MWFSSKCSHTAQDYILGIKKAHLFHPATTNWILYFMKTMNPYRDMPHGFYGIKSLNDYENEKKKPKVFSLLIIVSLSKEIYMVYPVSYRLIGKFFKSCLRTKLNSISTIRIHVYIFYYVNAVLPRLLCIDKFSSFIEKLYNEFNLSPHLLHVKRKLWQQFSIDHSNDHISHLQTHTCNLLNISQETNGFVFLPLTIKNWSYVFKSKDKVDAIFDGKTLFSLSLYWNHNVCVSLTSSTLSKKYPH